MNDRPTRCPRIVHSMTSATLIRAFAVQPPRPAPTGATSTALLGA